MKGHDLLQQQKEIKVRIKKVDYQINLIINEKLMEKEEKVNKDLRQQKKRKNPREN